VIYLLDKTTVVQLYQDSVLISRPRYDRELQLWVPYASIAWPEQSPSHYHQLTPFDKTFESEAEALAFGFIAARAWIHENLNVGQLA
jgi:hypothetical protein